MLNVLQAPEQRKLLVQELRAAGLTRDRMVRAAGMPGGFQVLSEIIDSHNQALRLRPGDRLALVTACADMAAAMAVAAK